VSTIRPLCLLCPTGEEQEAVTALQDAMVAQYGTVTDGHGRKITIRATPLLPPNTAYLVAVDDAVRIELNP